MFVIVDVYRFVLKRRYRSMECVVAQKKHESVLKYAGVCIE